MPELEHDLQRLRRELEFPETPPLAAAVDARLGSQPAPARLRRRRSPLVSRVLLAAVVVLLLLSAAAAAFPGARDAVLHFLGLRGATVERSERRPPGRLSEAPALGRAVTLRSAARQLAFEPLAPALTGPPDRVYLGSRAPGGRLSLAYRPRRGLPRAAGTHLGLLVTEFRGDLDPQLAGKVAGQGTRVERLRLDGERALWLEGAPHYFFYRDPRGRFAEDTLRLAGNVLLLERGRLLVRLEGAMRRERALAIARSLRRISP